MVSERRIHSARTNLEAAPRSKTDLLFFERRLYDQGMVHVGGTDEAGRGCLAGPVFAAAVILPPHLKIPGVNDSKLLTPATRETLFKKICQVAVSWGIGVVDQEEIDRINIHHASLKAMQAAVVQLNPPPDFLLVDGRFPIPNRLPQRPIVKGDQKSLSVAAASILAKVSRDRWMMKISREYPRYSFQEHKGYGTPQHLREIEKFGLTPLHRKSFCVSSLVS